MKEFLGFCTFGKKKLYIGELITIDDDIIPTFVLDKRFALRTQNMFIADMFLNEIREQHNIDVLMEIEEIKNE